MAQLSGAAERGGRLKVRAEGALALVLRASDVAARNGDRVHATIVGSGINQDGRTTGLSLPSPDAQAALLQQVYAEFGVAPDELAFIEAHGLPEQLFFGDRDHLTEVRAVGARGRDRHVGWVAPVLLDRRRDRRTPGDQRQERRPPHRPVFWVFEVVTPPS